MSVNKANRTVSSTRKKFIHPPNNYCMDDKCFLIISSSMCVNVSYAYNKNDVK